MDTQKDNPSKLRKVRKLTKFLCLEMLYDHLTGRLDKERAYAVEEFLRENSELKSEVEKMKYAINYCNQLSQTRATDSLIIPVKENKSYFVRVSKQMAWSNWPEFMKWSFEALLVSIIAAAFAIFVPWQDINILPKNDSPSPKLVVGQSEKISKPNLESTEQVGSDALDNKTEENSKSQRLTVGTAAEVTKINTMAESLKSNPPETIPSERDDNQLQRGANQDEESAEEERVGVTDEDQSGSKAKSALKGELYRAFMSHSDIDRVTAEMVEKITSMGGKKAGKVKLGWRKNDGSYFHMTINESNYDEFLAYLRTIGPVRIYKDPHRRVMPKGKIRVILWLEDSTLNK